MNTFQISSQYEQIIHELYDEEGNENPRALALLEENNLALQTKAIALASWIQNMEIEKESLIGAKKKINEAKENILAREKMLDSKIERWKKYIQENMERREIKEINCPYFVMKLAKNPFSIEIQDESKIDEEYWIISKRLDKIKMLNDMKVGVLINGASLKQENRLSIK